MDDFFKQFRENLERRPEPDFEEKDWRGMEKLLDAQGGKQLPVLAWWWVMPFLLLLLGANVFMLLEQKKVNRKLQEAVMLRDTVYQTRVIYHTDTIYRTQVIREETASGVRAGGPAIIFTPAGRQGGGYPAFSSLWSAGQPSAGLFLPGEARPYSALPGFRQERKEEQDAGQDNRLGPEEPHSVHALLAPLPSGNQPLLLPEKTFETEGLPAPTITKRRRTLMQLLYPLRPKGLMLGGGGGGAFPLGPALSRQAGGLAGVQVAVEFSPHIRMWMNASYFRIHIETDRMDESIGVPPVDPPSDDLIFSKAELAQPTLQLAAGMQYLFSGEGKWTPYLGLGYGAASLLPHDVVYEFRNPATEAEWNIDIRVAGRSWQTGFLLFQAGVEYEFSRRWSGQLGVNYRTNWNPAGSHSTRILGAGIGLMYDF